MRNIGKCKLCQSVIESHFTGDVVSCKCGEITVYDGGAMRMQCNNIENFLRVDDLGNEIVVHYVDKHADKANDDRPNEPPKCFTYDECVEMLENRVKYYGELPEHVLQSPIDHCDLVNFMLDVLNIFKRLERKEERPGSS